MHARVYLQYLNNALPGNMQCRKFILIGSMDFCHANKGFCLCIKLNLNLCRDSIKCLYNIAHMLDSLWVTMIDYAPFTQSTCMPLEPKLRVGIRLLTT